LTLKDGLQDRTNFAIRNLKAVENCLLAVTVNHANGFDVWGTLDGEY
jgi:hypothetical protein